MSQAAAILDSKLTHGQLEQTSAQAIESWLSAFGTRQCRLLWIQGVAITFLVVAVGAVVIVLLDGWGVVSDPLRWSLSLATYAMALAFGLGFGLLRAMRWPAPTELAERVEFACPELRESLLSTVELDARPVELRNFSGSFLRAVQRQVAYQLDDISIRELLPWSMIRIPSFASMAALLGLGILCLIPSLEMPQRLSRALLPFMDLERPSRTRIDVMAPKRPNVVVPENQSLEFEIEIQGVPADEAWLELRPTSDTAGIANERIAMTRIQSSPLRFAGTAPIGTQSIEYRFLAGDAVTKYRRVSPTARPRVVEFRHRIVFPEHVQLPPALVQSERGSVTALEGSTVEIGIQPSIPLMTAHAVVESLDTGDQESIPLTLNQDQSMWSFSWPVRSDARYQLKLAAKVSDIDAPIENTFSPFHEINAVADRPPAVVWIVTDTTLWDSVPRPNQTWIVAPEEIVPLAAAIADDLPSATLEQQFSVNRGPWESMPKQLALEDLVPSTMDSQRDWSAWDRLDGVNAPTRGQCEWVWDIMTASVAPGDTIAIRLAARDSLGQVTHSSTIELSIASSGFDRDRHEAMFLRASLVPELQRLADMLRKAREDFQPRLQRIQEGVWDTSGNKELERELNAFGQEWTAQCVRIRELAGTLVSRLPRPLDQSETEMVVRLVSRLERENASKWLAACRALIWPSDPQVASNGASLLPIPEKVVTLLKQQVVQGKDALSEAEGQSARLVDIYRQMVGHDCLTALSKDMIFLRDHQAEQLTRAPKMDFAMLSRSQRIAGQYLDTIAQLGQRMEPFVSQHLRDQLRNFYRFLDQSRSDFQELSQQEPSQQSQQELTQRIGRFVEEMRHQHWVFHLDGGVWWNIADARRDLIQRGVGVGNAMRQSIDAAYRSQEFLNDPSLDSELTQQLQSVVLNELTVGLLPATNQIIDRREFHQRRIPNDPVFPGDMGLAIRAWQNAIESWPELVPKSDASVKAREDLKGIASAYCVLEAAHEMQDIRGTLEALRRQEQYAWQSLEGRLNHLRQWESMDLRIDIAHQWMMSAGFPHSVANQFNQLRWKEASQRIRQKLEPRRNASNESLVNAATDIEALLLDWREVDETAAPTIEAARKFLARFAPSVSQLAKKAAEQTRAMQERSQGVADSQNTTKELTQQQDLVERSVKQLQDALLETAMRQDILNQQQLMLAKDSDRALQWVDEVAEAMQQANKALAMASQKANDPIAIANAADEAVEKQSAAAEAFEAIARHFSELESDIAPEQAAEESNATANPLETPTADASEQPLENYDKADRLAAMANSDPEQLLQQLEAELERNRPMQRELSQLSRESVSDAIAQLKNAAAQEDTLARQLENADLTQSQNKEIQAQQLRQVADSLERFAVSLLEKSSQAGRRMNLPETSESLTKVAQSIQQAARNSRQADPSDTQSNLDAISQNLLEKVNEAQQALSELAPRIQERIEQPSSPDPKQRLGQLTEMQSWQSLMRDDLVRRAKDKARENQQQAENRKRESDERQREAQQRLDQMRKASDALQKAPDNESLQSQSDQATRDLFEAAERSQQAKRLADASEKIAERSAERASEIENAPRANLDKPNPVASLATEQLGIAKSQLDEAQSALSAMQESTQARQPPAPKASAVIQSQSKQQEIGASVKQVAEQLERSSRHEARLNNTEGSQQLGKQSKEVGEVAEQEVANAQQQLEQASNNARQAERQSLEQARDNPTPIQAPRPSAENAIESARQAAQRLKQSAQSVEQLDAPKSGDSKGETTGSQSQTQGGESAAQSAKHMARMLDSLDQQLRSGQATQQNKESSNAESSQTSPPAQSSDSSQPNENAQASETSRPGEASQSSRPGQSNPSNRQSQERSGLENALRESANEVAAQLQNERLSNRDGAKAKAKAKSQSNRSPSTKYGGQPNDQGRTENAPTGDSRLPAAMLDPGNDWGRLREKRAEDVTQGRRESLDPEFNEAIRAYYRALGSQPK